MRNSSATGSSDKRIWLIASLAALSVLGSGLVLVKLHHMRSPVTAFETIRPGMTYQEVRAVLAQRHVAVALASSFGTPNKDSAAVLHGNPSFESREWGRVDGPFQYEPQWARPERSRLGLPLSAGKLRMYTTRQWGVANTQSYSFTAVFDEEDILQCHFWNTPSESWLRGRVRVVFGW
jgi:hypothetical protein